MQSSFLKAMACCQGIVLLLDQEAQMFTLDALDNLDSSIQNSYIHPEPTDSAPNSNFFEKPSQRPLPSSGSGVALRRAFSSWLAEAQSLGFGLWDLG